MNVVAVRYVSWGYWESLAIQTWDHTNQGVNTKNPSLPFPYSPTLFLVWQIQYYFPRSGEPSRMQIQPWASRWSLRAGSVTWQWLRLCSAHCQVTTACSERQLWALASRWAREGRQVCVLILPLPLVSGKLEISVFQGRGRKVTRAQPASSPTWHTAPCQPVTLLLAPSYGLSTSPSPFSYHWV